MLPRRHKGFLRREISWEIPLMGKRKSQITGVRGWQHLKSGDVITIMDRGEPLKCRVIFCIVEGDDRFHANLEVIEGERKGERFITVLKLGGPDEAPGVEGTG